MLSRMKWARFISPAANDRCGSSGSSGMAHREARGRQLVCFGVVPHASERIPIFRCGSSRAFGTAEWGFAMGPSSGQGGFMDGAKMVVTSAFDVIGTHAVEGHGRRANGAATARSARWARNRRAFCASPSSETANTSTRRCGRSWTRTGDVRSPYGAPGFTETGFVRRRPEAGFPASGFFRYGANRIGTPRGTLLGR